MTTDFAASWKRRIALLAAANLLGMAVPANGAPAGNQDHAQAQEIGSKSAGAPTERSKSAKRPARRSPGRQSVGSGNFVYEIINQIREQSGELCARYGSASDCLEEAEVCLTMRDVEDNQVRLCLNTVPGDAAGDENSVQRSRLRR